MEMRKRARFPEPNRQPGAAVRSGIRSGAVGVVPEWERFELVHFRDRKCTELKVPRNALLLASNELLIVFN